MSYVNKALLPGEQVEYQAKIHWFIFFPGLLALVVSIGLMVQDGGGSKAGSGVVLAFMLIPVSLWLLVKAFLIRLSTELAVTNKRVIAKVGLIRRDTLELQLSKVESFQVDQTILGRLFGFGTVTISGTGAASMPLKSIDDPLKFRRESMRAADGLVS